ncbi:MAG: hypothetical protein JWM28_3596 [Chitinophagaceae bacterium]|nr:hypothetical protein [Chitinophagaceae bacterium]
MKKIFTLSLIPVIAVLFLVGCSKRSYIDFDERYWLSQERGDVVYSSPDCDFYIVDTYNGYAVVQSWNGYRPFEGTVLYGNFSSDGTRDFYDRANGILISGDVRDYWLTYSAAQQALDYNCN